jgi:hypothetical protein
MQALDAHAAICELPDDDLTALFPECARIEGSRAERLYMPLLITGGIALSGMLDHAETIDDLREAAAHFATLLNAEIVTWEQWNESTRAVWDALELFARQFDRVEELN